MGGTFCNATEVAPPIIRYISKKFPPIHRDSPGEPEGAGRVYPEYFRNKIFKKPAFSPDLKKLNNEPGNLVHP